MDKDVVEPPLGELPARPKEEPGPPDLVEPNAPVAEGLAGTMVRLSKLRLVQQHKNWIPSYARSEGSEATDPS